MMATLCSKASILPRDARHVIPRNTIGAVDSAWGEIQYYWMEMSYDTLNGYRHDPGRFPSTIRR